MNGSLAHGLRPDGQTAVGVDAMAAEIERREKGRLKRKLGANGGEGANVQSINERNEAYVKRINKAFDKHTTDIRQNLERGTAL